MRMHVTFVALLGAALAGGAPRLAAAQQPDSAATACGCPMMQGGMRQGMMMSDSARAAMRAQHRAAMHGSPQCAAMMRQHMAAMHGGSGMGMGGGMGHGMMTGADSTRPGVGAMPRTMRDSVGPGAGMGGHGAMMHGMPGAGAGGMVCPRDSTGPRASAPPGR